MRATLCFLLWLTFFRFVRMGFGFFPLAFVRHFFRGFFSENFFFKTELRSEKSYRRNKFCIVRAIHAKKDFMAFQMRRNRLGFRRRSRRL